MNDPFGSISIQDIRRGMLIWECESGKDVCILAVADATREDDGWTVQARIVLAKRPNQVGNYQKLYQRDTAGAYGLRLYNSPQYTNPPMFELLSNISTVVADEWKIAQTKYEGLNLAATQYSESRDLWMGRARTAQDRIGQLEDSLRSIGIAYSDYIRRPNEQTFMHLMDLARAALESEATA